MPRTNLASLLESSAADNRQASAQRRGPRPAETDEPQVLSVAPQQDGAPTGRPMASLHDPADRRQPPDTAEPDRRSGQGESPVATAEDQAAISTLPRYLQLERKELRIRLDQADDLARLTRRLNRARRGTGERITDNTLIRVAIDLLLQQSDRLVGTTEDELRKSLTP